VSASRATSCHPLLMVALAVAPAAARAAELPDAGSKDLCVSAVPGKPLPAGVACIALSFDLRTDYRARSTRREAVAEPWRDDEGPGLDIYAGRIPGRRPTGRLLVEGRVFAEARVGTASGKDVSALVGVRLQLETPPRRRDRPRSDFERTGRRALLERARIQFGGLSAGYQPSAFYFTPGLTYTTAYAAEQSSTSIQLRARLASDWHVVAAIEDSGRRRLIDRAWGRYRSGSSLDPVIALQKSFAWGNAQIATAVHPIRARATDPCCARVTGHATGWAAMAGVEGWVETAIGSSEFLVNISAADGALDYLNATNYPADFVVETDGKLRTARGYAGVIALANSWTKQVRTIVSISAVRSRLDADRFAFRNAGLIAQLGLEYRAGRQFVIGIEGSYNRDRLRDRVSHVTNDYLSGVVYIRKRMRLNLRQA
jgi:hypothetical protein